MRSEYFGSAKITYLDKERVWQALRELAERLGRAHPEVLRVAVFGSLARGEAAPGSDIDLLLVLQKSDLEFRDRAGHFRPPRFLVPLDVFAYTQTEIDRMLSDGNFFLKRALDDAVTLFERDA